MAKALKLMTWNVQHLPPEAGGKDYVARATTQAQAILALPERDQPDLIAFNEVFEKKAREKLVEILKDKYPSFIDQIAPDILFVQDSGLMLFSKHEILSLPGGKKYRFKRYKKAKDWDALAQKGIAQVKINGPRGITVVAFTHTQSGTSHATTRKAQLADIFSEVTSFANTPSLAANKVLMGDLNVHGIVNATTGEMVQVFKNMAGKFGNMFIDSWPATVRPPQDTHVHDPGHTHQKDAAGLDVNRLDYFCLPRGTAAQPGLVSHHTWVAIKPPFSVSDHWAMMSILHGPAPHCSPSSGLNISALAPALTDPGGARLWQVAATIPDQGMYFWLFLNAPGTYAFFGDSKVEMAVYKRSDLSHAVAASGAATAGEFPVSFGAALAPFPPGKRWAMAEPSFVRIRGTAESFTGSAQLAVVQQSAAIT